MTIFTRAATTAQPLNLSQPIDAPMEASPGRAVTETMPEQPARQAGSITESSRVARVASQAPTGVDTVELVRLYNAISEATGKRSGTITQFVSSSKNGSSTEIAYSTAWIGAALMGRTVLFIDASMGAGQKQPVPRGTASKALRDVALGEVGVEDALVRQTNISLFLATLEHERLKGDSVLAARQITKLLEQLRHSFDMIIIAPPAALDQPLAAMLTPFVDGSVLVLEAGTSRNSTSLQTVELLRSGGSPILGAVMNSRRRAVPRWLRRWF